MQVNKYYVYSILIILYIVISCSRSTAQIIPSSVDISYLLNSKSDISFSHKVVSTTHNKWVILDVSTKNRLNFDSLIFAYSFADKLDNPLSNFKEVNLKSYELYETATNKMYAFEPANNTYKFLILRVYDVTTKKNYTYIINLEKSSSFFITKTDLTIPILENFSPKNSLIKIGKLEGLKSNFKFQFYTTKFPAALPPMANIKNNSLFNEADTTYSISNDTILPTTNEGLYSIFEEGHENTVSFFKITSNRYPQLSNIDEIINASIYLFTKKEKDKLAKSTEQKKDYDSFWLENTNSSERAGKMISAYFTRVNESNTLFSTYKDGWKTDMGMIYIIFGPPNKVFRSNESILWIYEKTYELPSLQFNFYLKSKNLDSEYFELERNIKYQNTWFRTIDLWRKGRKNL